MLDTGWIVFLVCIGVFSGFGLCWAGYKMSQRETPSEPTEEINNFLSWGSIAHNDYSLI